MSMNETIVQALNWRYAVKVFDQTRKVSEANLRTILESAHLAPSSLGIEPWKFIVVENPEMRAKLRAAGYDQTKITDASHLVVVAFRTDVREHIVDETISRTAKVQNVDPSALDAYRKMIEGGVASRDDAQLSAWVRSQVYIPLGMMMETAALLGIDACPMEGFDAAQINALLGLNEQHLSVTAMLAIGYRGEDPAATRPKVRRTFEEAIEFIK